MVLAVFDEVRLRRWGRRHGIDPFALQHVAAVRTGGGWLGLIRGPLDASWQVRELGARMSGLRVRAERPWPRRWGWVGGTLLDVTALAPDVLMLATDVASADALRASLRHPATVGPRDGGDTPPWPSRAFVEASVALAAFGRPTFPSGSAVGLLLAETQRVSLVLARGHAPGLVRLMVRLDGAFPATAEVNFERLARSVAGSTLGGLLGLHDALPTLGVEASERRVVLSLEPRADRLARGIRSLLRAEMPELLDWPPAGQDEAGATGSPSRSHPSPNGS